MRLMAWASGIATCIVSFGKNTKPDGTPIESSLRVDLVAGDARALVWNADGSAMLGVVATAKAEADELGTIALPVVDQAGWIDDSGAAFMHWAYRLTETSGGVTRVKLFSPLNAQLTADFDLIPDGTAGTPTVGAAAFVSDIGGATGSVTAAALSTLLGLARKADLALSTGKVPLAQTAPKPRLLRPRFLNPDDPFPAPPAVDMPTITENAGATTTIASGTAHPLARTVAAGPWDPADPKFELNGSPSYVGYASSPTAYVQSERHVNAPSDAYVWKLSYAFETNAEQVELRHIAASSSAKFGLIRVNGRFVSMTAETVAAAGGSTFTRKLTFIDSRPRLIEVFSAMPRGGFAGIYATPNRYVTRPKRKALTTVGLIGSSILDGALTVGNMETYGIRLAHMLGADRIILGGIGTTGYLATGASGNRYRDRIAGMLAQNPDVLIFDGSRNDSTFGAAELTAEVQYVLDATASVPERYGLSIITSGTYAAVNTAVKAGFASRGVPYADISGMIFGTGFSGAPTNDGNADVYIGTDGVHPTALGHAKLADWYADALAGVTTVGVR